MGEIIRFRPRQGAKQPGVGSADTMNSGAGSAEILLFTGVRYERHEGATKALAKGTSRRGRGKKRA